ncbi:MAG: HPF/RaiA family ribosome-associated protein [Gammaproteobacteria bacterium]|nr:MAG: HPF/RaiA family ribosome-associated protein [Gammaproteobacteria bacterium]
MRIDIHTGSFSLTDGLRKHVEHRVRSTLSWAQQGLQNVSLRLEDINGPKGGVDKSCRIQIPVAGGTPVVIHEVQPDLYVAIDRALERAGRALSRKLARKRDFTHKRLVSTLIGDADLAPL